MPSLTPKPHLNFLFHHGFVLFLFVFIFLLIHSPPPATAQLPNTLTPPPPAKLTKLKFDKSMAIVLVILVVVFFILGCLSVYTRQCAERRIRGRLDLTFPIGSHRRQRGLDPEVIDTFPTFVYSTVKGLKIGRATLECAVCLSEFQDDETLRLIPKCSHVFHPDCIDAWLTNHSTCPVCRANLVPRPGDTSSIVIQIPDHGPEPDYMPRPDTQINEVPSPTPRVADSPKVNTLDNQNRPPRSRSTGFMIAGWFPRSHTTGHSVVQPGENHERFTLRLPDEVRTQLMNSTMLNRAKSWGVTFTRESSGRRGYRTRSVGSSNGYEQFSRQERRGFSWGSPFFGRAGSSRSARGSSGSSRGHVAMDDVGERSSDRLFAGAEAGRED